MADLDQDESPGSMGSCGGNQVQQNWRGEEGRERAGRCQFGEDLESGEGSQGNNGRGAALSGRRERGTAADHQCQPGCCADGGGCGSGSGR